MRNKNGIKRVKDQHRYPVDLKRKIAKSYLAGEGSYGILAKENGLKNGDVVREFVKWYCKELLKESEMSMKTTTSKKEQKGNLPEVSSDNQLPTMEEFLLLKQKLYESELKVEGLKTMIDIAEATFKIPIKKKSGSKQSKQ